MKFIYYWFFNIFLAFSLVVDGQLMDHNLEELLSLECDQPLVTLHIFSARTNPVWKMNITQNIRIKAVAKSMADNHDNKRSSNISNTRVMGYQGFSISCLDKKEVFIHGAMPIEKALLDSGRPYLSPTIVQYVSEHLGQDTSLVQYKSLNRINCDYVPIKGPDSVPIFNPRTDNGGCFITKQSKNNCYAYGKFK